VWITVFAFALLYASPSSSAARKNGFNLDNASVPKREIRSGGPPRDGIPAITEPEFVSRADADYLKDDDRVLGVTISGEPKAYPIRILDYHEIVNDKSGVQHFTVTYCPLCGTGMVFATNAGELHLNFGVSGLLYNSDVLLYDRNTESLWSQIMGEAIAGKLLGHKLPQLPVFHTTWSDWQSKHPDTLVLSNENQYRFNYKKPLYAGYSDSRKLYFKVSNKAPKTYHPKEQVMGLNLGDEYKAYPFAELAKNNAEHFEDSFGGKTFTVHWNDEAKSAHITDAQGKSVVTTTAYWFAWFTFHPQTSVFKASP
jgi:hypothetical protein